VGGSTPNAVIYDPFMGMPLTKIQIPMTNSKGISGRKRIKGISMLKMAANIPIKLGRDTRSGRVGGMKSLVVRSCSTISLDFRGYQTKRANLVLVLE
jgi:hypothetical protein